MEKKGSKNLLWLWAETMKDKEGRKFWEMFSKLKVTPITKGGKK